MDTHADSLLALFPPVPKRLLTVHDYHRMGDAGILTRDDQVELIEGELVAMAPIGSEHADTVTGLTRVLILAVGDSALVRVQIPLRLDLYNEPEPDFALVRPRPGGYRSAHPGPADVLLVIEIAKSSLSYDRGPKRALYARTKLPEFWIVNLVADEVEVHRSPVGDAYTSISRVPRSGLLDIAALPGIAIPAAPLFGM